MTEQLDFGALRELLHGTPSAARWRGLMWLVSGRAWDMRAEEWLPYAQGVLDERWPDALRVWLLGLRWSSAPKAANQLVRAYNITREVNSAGQLRFELERWSRHDPALTILGLQRVRLDADSAAALVERLPPTLHTLMLGLRRPHLQTFARALFAAEPARAPALERLKHRSFQWVEGRQEVWSWLGAEAMGL